MRGDIPALVHICGRAYNMTVPALRTVLDTNPMAAMPSLHAAFPACCALAAVRAWRLKGATLWLYVAAMAFALVYLGEHYAVDVLAGVALAVVAWHAITRWPAATRWLGQLAWTQWRAVRHFGLAILLLLTAMLVSTWTVALRNL